MRNVSHSREGARGKVVRQAKLGERLRGLGVRLTAQRLAIAEVLANSEDHPTAQEVYQRAKARLPHITMGTVYNTINTLAKSGLIQPLPFPDGSRYDTNQSAHVNLVCIECGSIVDVPDEGGVVKRLRKRVVSKSGFRVISQRVDFYGLCPRCAPQASRR